ncbi:hypothetical protein GCM10007874_22620 [Labrys miyagiensis]|uniref:Transcriptional regulator TetR C-terminal Proteobacteria type domain-containing protein n=1 Tax=Labrys miyagiensis TaxID=346912 RepID=A0ABQ6CH63_9HYPH|nr:hypothetical protein GCM10007874_22620 [Labrys miyagiensis]
MADYILNQNTAGVLKVPDLEMAAQQFLSLVRGNLHLREVLSNEPCSETERERLIDTGVALFLSGYGALPLGRVTPLGTAANSEKH